MLLLCLSGCGERTVTGGTPGTLTIDGENYAEIQLTIHRVKGEQVETLGFGVTDAEGKFLLLKNGAAGKLFLEPGEYRATVETIGPDVAIPNEYLQAETTPLKVEWTGKDEQLSLNVKPNESSEE
jgi:hypothetical protein